MISLMPVKGDHFRYPNQFQKKMNMHCFTGWVRERGVCWRELTVDGSTWLYVGWTMFVVPETYNDCSMRK